MQIMRSSFMILKVSPFALWGKYAVFRFYENRFPIEKTCFAVKPKYVTREKRFALLNFYQILSQLVYLSAKPVSEHSRETDINALENTEGCMQIMRSCFMILKVSPFALWGKYSKSRRNESYVSIMNIRQLHWYESVITQRRKNFHAVTKPHMSFHNYANYACFDQSQTKKFI